MGKLHELLAVEADLEGVSRRVSDEAMVTFAKKHNHFQASHKFTEMFDENVQGDADSHLEMVDTVNSKLDYMAGKVASYYNVVLQKEATNQAAKADLIVDGQTLATDLPATFLLGLETKLKNLRKVYENIPTLQPGVKWELDDSQGSDIFKAAHTSVRNKTRRVTRHTILVEPTQYHPAQVDKWEDVEVIGHIKEDHWSSMITPARKSELLGRIDSLIQGVKKARMRANTTEVVSKHVGEDLFKFIHA